MRKGEDSAVSPRVEIISKDGNGTDDQDLLPTGMMKCGPTNRVTRIQGKSMLKIISTQITRVNISSYVGYLHNESMIA